MNEQQASARRQMIKAMGSAFLPAFLPFSMAESETNQLPAETRKPVTFVVIGAGNRGNTYSEYAAKYPDQMQVVGVAEPIESRREALKKKFNIPGKQCFTTWEHVFQVPRFADAVIVSTPDALHFGPAMKAMDLGYHVLLEKPISPSESECVQIAEKAKKTGSIVAVCHVLRYTPYFKKLKEIIDSGVLGDLVNIDHMEPVGYWHMAHSFVRGNWRNEAESSFMLLAKSCHDMDMIRWLANKPCTRVASFGSLKHFKKENAPQGSSKRCIDCAVEPDCPYSALKVYLNMNNKGWPVSVMTEDFTLEGRMKALREGPYGRCVYHCDNDVVDHQVMSMEFEGGLTANFTMSAFTPQQGMGSRQTRLMGTRGYLDGNMSQFTVTQFVGNKQETFKTNELGGDAGSGHGGGDFGLMGNFVKALAEKNNSLLTSTVEVSVESHIMAFRGEESRKKGQVIKI